MNKLEQPTFFDDHAALVALSENPRATSSYPNLIPHIAAIRAGYTDYIAAGGNAKAIKAVALPADIQTMLKGHYSQPSSDISYINTIREQGGFKTCPMCGSTHSGTLDHILPQTGFASFAIFGLNLVPACKCNSLRGRALVGQNPGERVLHPYFDQILSERLLAASFEDLGAVPRVCVRIVLDYAHPAFPGVQFHFNNIVRRTQVEDWIAGQWTKMVLRPGNVIRDLRQNPVTREALIAILEEELNTVDAARESKNNWDSIFLAGLLDDPVVDWLFQRLSNPGRIPNSALDTV